MFVTSSSSGAMELPLCHAAGPANELSFTGCLQHQNADFFSPTSKTARTGKALFMPTLEFLCNLYKRCSCIASQLKASEKWTTGKRKRRGKMKVPKQWWVNERRYLSFFHLFCSFSIVLHHSPYIYKRISTYTNKMAIICLSFRQIPQNLHKGTYNIKDYFLDRRGRFPHDVFFRSSLWRTRYDLSSSISLATLMDRVAIAPLVWDTRGRHVCPV